MTVIKKKFNVRQNGLLKKKKVKIKNHKKKFLLKIKSLKKN